MEKFKSLLAQYGRACETRGQVKERGGKLASIDRKRIRLFNELVELATPKPAALMKPGPVCAKCHYMSLTDATHCRRCAHPVGEPYPEAPANSVCPCGKEFINYVACPRCGRDVDPEEPAVEPEPTIPLSRCSSDSCFQLYPTKYKHCPSCGCKKGETSTPEELLPPFADVKPHGCAQCFRTFDTAIYKKCPWCDPEPCKCGLDSCGECGVQG